MHDDKVTHNLDQQALLVDATIDRDGMHFSREALAHIAAALPGAPVKWEFGAQVGRVTAATVDAQGRVFITAQIYPPEQVRE